VHLKSINYLIHSEAVYVEMSSILCGGYPVMMIPPGSCPPSSQRNIQTVDVVILSKILENDQSQQEIFILR
jgi:hypothetical protein